MKLKITLKDPDGVYDSIRDAAKDSVRAVEGLDDDEREELLGSRHDKIAEQCKPWIDCGEYVRIEIDTEAGTATVCKA